jgi:hypothetical protein
MRVTRAGLAWLHDARVHIDDSFIGADLHDDGDTPRSLDDACRRVEEFSPELSSAGWSCRFFSRLSPADRIYLASALDVELSAGDDFLLAVCAEFYPRISLFLFWTETEGMCEFILIPWEGEPVNPPLMLAAANDVLVNLVDVVGWDPHDELRRYRA